MFTEQYLHKIKLKRVNINEFISRRPTSDKAELQKDRA
jgi:hypothetical protein